MIQPKDQIVRSLSLPSRWFPITAVAALAAAGVFSACGDDETALGTGGSGGGTGVGGSAGLGGSAGSVDAGSAGSGGSGLTDAGNGSGVTGTVTQLSADAALLFPTTAAFRGTDVFVVNGQLNALGGTPALPFTVVSVPLTGGAINNTINLPGNSFFPEGIAAAADGTLYVGSTQQGIIVRVPSATTTPDATPFVAAGVAQRGVVGLEVDAAHSLLWFCDSNPAGPGGAALVGVDLANGTEAVRHTVPNPGASNADAGLDAGVDAGADAGADAGDAGASTGPTAFCNDVVVQSTGNVFFTDSSGRVFRIPSASVRTPNSAQVWLEGSSVASLTPGGFGANGLALVGDQLIIGNTDHLIAVDPDSNNAASTVRSISLTESGAAVTLCGPDGLETVPNSNTDLVVVENGSCTAARERVVRVSLRGL
jgi:sugar lactone lactonase YvrE